MGNYELNFVDVQKLQKPDWDNYNVENHKGTILYDGKDNWNNLEN